MPSKIPSLITAELHSPGKVSLAWDDGVSCLLDLSDILPVTATAPIVEDWGHTLKFTGTDKDFSSPGLYKRAAWQDGRAPRPEVFREWRKRIGMTQEQLAAALELGRRTIGYYEDGTLLIPRVVALAMKGLETERHQAA